MTTVLAGRYTVEDLVPGLVDVSSASPGLTPSLAVTPGSARTTPPPPPPPDPLTVRVVPHISLLRPRFFFLVFVRFGHGQKSSF